MKTREPSKLEMQVLSVLWRRGPSTVRDVLEAMSDGKARAYTTILSVMQVMEKKGLVGHTAQGNTHVYEAKVSRARAIGPMLRDLVRDVFGGSTVEAMQQLLDENKVSAEELAEIQKIIAERDKQGRK